MLTAMADSTLTPLQCLTLCRNILQADSLRHAAVPCAPRTCPHAACLSRQALNVKESTTTPLWKGLWVMLKYRTRSNYVRHAPACVGTRVWSAF